METFSDLVKKYNFMYNSTFDEFELTINDGKFLLYIQPIISKNKCYVLSYEDNDTYIRELYRSEDLKDIEYQLRKVTRDIKLKALGIT